MVKKIASALPKKSLRLARSARLRNRRDFEFIQNKGARASTRDLMFSSRAGTGTESRVGFTISTRVDKRSVIRNKIKRRLREIFRALRPEFLTTIDVVVIARGSAVNATFEELRSQVIFGLQKLKVLPT